MRAQEFDLTETEKNIQISDIIYLYLTENKNDTISKYKVYPSESDIGQKLEIDEITSLEGFKTKIRVEIQSTACCTSIETHYLLIDSDNNIVKLPGIKNYHCDGPEPKYDLIFPEHKYGVPNAIVKAKLIFDENYKLKNYKEISKIYYDGSNFIELLTIANE